MTKRTKPANTSTVVVRLGGVEIRVDGTSRADCLKQLLRAAEEADRS
jgi:hypothetical protein